MTLWLHGWPRMGSIDRRGTALSQKDKQVHWHVGGSWGEGGFSILCEKTRDGNIYSRPLRYLADQPLRLKAWYTCDPGRSYEHQDKTPISYYKIGSPMLGGLAGKGASPPLTCFYGLGGTEELKVHEKVRALFSMVDF